IISRPDLSPTCARRGYLWPPKFRCRIRPSSVLSNSAPHASSSRTRSGDSFAWSSAMRQLFRYWPPRMVSAKCTFQPSRSSTFASAAATPPSAITVWAFPNNDRQMTATLAPAAEASIAARSPAPPEPTTRTSYVNVSNESMSKNPVVGPYSHRAKTYVDVREHHPEEAHPCPLHVTPVQATGTFV